MNTTEKDIELFDSYMDGKLSESESAQFEERLRTDEAFKKEYELHSQIVLGIQRKELKAMLQEEESVFALRDELSDSSSVAKLPAAASKPGRIIPMFVKWAVAACFFVGIYFAGKDLGKQSALGGVYIAQLEAPVVKGSGVEETLALICENLQQGNYSEAQENIDKARDIIHKEQSVEYDLSTPEAQEEYEYRQQMLKLDTDELDWYQALLYTKTHRYFKAKILLKQIEKSDSRYCKLAKELK